MKGQLKIHSENILPIIKKWLYSDKDIFVRELVSNSCDAISKLFVLQEQEGLSFGEEPFHIDIVINKEAKTITISDNGIGMTADEVEKYIAQVAFSGAEEFVKTYKTDQEKNQFIGHFGLGFYSAFMVSRLVEIDTLSYREGAVAAFWSCDGSSEYSLVEGKRTKRGTDIILHIEDEEYLDSARIRTILKKYCGFLPYPIHLNGEAINSVAPLWMKPASECTDQDYIDFYHELYPHEPSPVFWIHLNVDHPFHLKGILYFPKITPRFDYQTSKIKLFSNRVFVSDRCEDLFPHFLTIMQGAIDSSDIPLNVSRSSLQMDSTVRKLTQHISKKISDRLSALYTSEKDRFISYWPDFSTIIKLGILHDEKFYERAQSFLLWKTTKQNWLTVEEYPKYAGKIFYTTHGSDETGFLHLYKEKNVEVVFADGALDTAIFNYLESKHDVHFQRIDGGIDDLILDKTREKDLLYPDGRSEAATIASYIKSQLQDKEIEVEAKSLTSDHLPAFVVIDERSRRLRDYLSLTQKEMPQHLLHKHTLVVNTNNPLISTIIKLKDKNPDLSSSLIHQIYDLSLLQQKELHPELLSTFIQRTSDLLQKLALQIHEPATPVG